MSGFEAFSELLREVPEESDVVGGFEARQLGLASSRERAEGERTHGVMQSAA